MKNVILIAAPAAGKGTEAALLKEQYNMVHISTGDLLRNAVSKEDERGNKPSDLSLSHHPHSFLLSRRRAWDYREEPKSGLEHSPSGPAMLPWGTEWGQERYAQSHFPICPDEGDTLPLPLPQACSLIHTKRQLTLDTCSL